MAKIVIDARFYGTEHTGLGRYTMNVLKYLPKYLKKHELLILLRPPHYNTLSFPPNCTKIRCDLPHYSFAEQLLLPLQLLSLSPDLLYTFHFNTPILSRVPMIVTVHDLIKSYFTSKDTTTRASWLFRLKRLGYKITVNQTLTRAVDVIVPTNTVKNQILANYPKVAPEHIHPIPEAPDDIFVKQSLKLSSALDLPHKYLLYVGNAYPHKNLSVLLDALKALKDPSIHLVVVSKLNPFLSRTLAPYEPKNIHIMSELTDSELYSVYQNASALVTPSLMEGYGLVGLEALMLGIPVVASNIPVYREVYGSRVTYFEPKNVDGLVKAIKTVLKNPKPEPLPLTRTWENVSESIAEVINASCSRLRSSK